MLYSENIKFSKSGVSFTDKHGTQLSLQNTFKKSFGRVYNWWADLKLFKIHVISLHVPIYPVRKLVFKLAGVKIGKGTTIHMGCKFFDPGGVTIGNDTIIGDRAFLDGRAPLVIGDHVDVASEVMIYNSEHNLDDPNFAAITESVEVGDYVFIGPRAIILPGVKIGKGAVVAAGAVVTSSVSNYKIVGGVPAKVIGERKLKKLNYRLGRARLFQ